MPWLSWRLFFLTLFFWGLLRPAVCLADIPANGNQHGHARRVGKIAAAGLDELSGLAASQCNDRLLWAINDSGHPPLIFAVGANGADHGYVRVTGARNQDWEDIASFSLGPGDYLLIADTGDNHSRRRQCSLYIIAEPLLTGPRFDSGATVGIIAQIRFTYEDGPRDCEAVAVDVSQHKILLLTKRTLPPVVYELPLVLTPGPAPAVARRCGPVAGITMPTAMDISRQADTGAILTYNRAYLFIRRAIQPGSSIFLQAPKAVTFPVLWQQEALCFGKTGRFLYISSEGRFAPLLRIDLTHVLP